MCGAAVSWASKETEFNVHSKTAAEYNNLRPGIKFIGFGETYKPFQTTIAAAAWQKFM